ncbi:hypothetical protein KGO06_01045 [Patescibacteria group bacterium]|nr:hypothetical protein [Patescibacteria group bacterium]
MIWTLILGVAALITAYYIFALFYHWLRFSATMPMVWLAIPVYLGGVVFLSLIALAAYNALV